MQYKNNFWASNIYIKNNKINFNLHSPFGSTKIILSLLGLHNIENALAAAALSISCNASLSAIKLGLKTIKPIPGRLYPIYLSKYKLIIDDSYNSNFGSMIAAINLLSKISGYRVMVIGDMAELGDQSKLYHSKIGNILKNSGINYVMTFGTFSVFINQNIDFGKHFINKDLIVDYVKKLLSVHDKITILVKGSRSMGMEYIVKILQEINNGNFIG